MSALPKLLVIAILLLGYDAAVAAASKSRKAAAQRPPTATPAGSDQSDESAEATAEQDDDEAAAATSNRKPAKARRDAGPAKAPGFRQVQRVVLQKMKAKDADIRATAFEPLVDHPSVDAAKLLVQQGLVSKHEEVRRAAYETLLSFNGDGSVADFLLGAAEKDLKRAAPREATCASVGAMLASDVPAIEHRALAVLDQAVNQPRGGLLFLVSLADALGGEGDETSLATLVKIAKRPIFDNQFAVRRSVVQAINKVELPAAVDALISILQTVKGEVRGDIVQRLAAVTGEKLGLDPPAWAAWWEKNQATFEFPEGALPPVSRAEALKLTSMYYGMPIYAARLVFVLDTSRSMAGPRIEAAKRELVSAINGLPEGVYFGVLVFNSEVRPWRRQLELASAENRAKAVTFVQAQGLGRSTASYDALEAAFDFDAESIYFLTDGAPHGGKVTDPVEIVDVISRLNFTRRITVNAIGVGVNVGLPGLANPFDDFLRSLSAHNYGEYRRVDR